MSHPSSNGISVLIIDDNKVLLDDYKVFLEDSGIEVYSAESAETGLSLAAKHTPSVIILDLMMPEVNGLEALERLKSNNETQAIPVIVFTALVNELEKKNSLKSGAEDYLEKVETEPAQLLSKIRHLAKKNHEG
jgi:CheY-like chemotaxis protein